LRSVVIDPDDAFATPRFAGKLHDAERTAGDGPGVRYADGRWFVCDDYLSQAGVERRRPLFEPVIGAGDGNAAPELSSRARRLVDRRAPSDEMCRTSARGSCRCGRCVPVFAHEKAI